MTFFKIWVHTSRDRDLHLPQIYWEKGPTQPIEFNKEKRYKNTAIVFYVENKYPALRTIR